MATKKPTNRLHSPSRWPADPFERLALAETDLEFVAVILRLGTKPLERDKLARIARIAVAQKEQAEREIERSGRKARKPK